MGDGWNIQVDLSSDGLLWLINRVVFHPRGFALAYKPEKGTFVLMGDGAEPWTFDAETVDEDALFRQVEAAFARARR